MCAVVNVNDPKHINDVDPRVTGNKEPEDVVAIKNEVAKARARRELVQETKLTEDLTNPPPAEAPFKVSGGINLGNIDIQEQQRQAREEAKAAQAAAAARIEKAEAEAREAREALNTANLKHMQDNLMAQIDSLKSAIQSGSKRDIVSELDAVEAVASKLGLSRSSSGGGGANLDTMLALKKLEQEMKREDRRFALEMKKDERMWQLELKKLEQSAKESEARAEAERNKYAMLAALPEQLGGVIAKGVLARADGISASPKTAPANGARPTRIIEAGEGEAGEIACPVCNTPVGVAPTTRNTICAGCQQPFQIKRIAPQADLQPVASEDDRGDRG